MTISHIYQISSYLLVLGSLIIVICNVIKFSSRANYIKVLGLYASVSVLFSLAQYIAFWRFKSIDTNYFANGFVLVEVWFFSLLYFHATRSKIFRKRILFVATLYSILYVGIFLFFIENSFSFIRFGRDFLIIFYSLAYFFYLIRKLPEEDLLKLPMFWINSIVIFYFSGTLILSFMRDYIVFVLKDDLTGFWAFRNLFRFGFCLVLAYAGWLDYKSIKGVSTN